MICFPNAKINLGLKITGKRDDGFHNIETILYPFGLCDALEIIVAPDKKFQFQSSGLNIPGDPVKNLCVKAYKILALQFNLAAIKIYLHKKIPIGAGLGGGSSDAAHTIILLNKLFKLGLNPDEMKDHARQLGSDCAFFIENKPSYAYNKGDHFTPLELNLKGLHIAIIKPSFNISTKEAYSGIRLLSDDTDIKQTMRQPLSAWKTDLQNDFELSVFEKYPEIVIIKDKLYDHGAVYASMSGSGSAVFGIFRNKPVFENLSPEYFYWEGILQ